MYKAATNVDSTEINVVVEGKFFSSLNGKIDDIDIPPIMIIRFTPCILKLMVESLGYVTLFTVQSRFFIKLGLVECSNVSTNSFNLQRDTFVYHH